VSDQKKLMTKRTISWALVACSYMVAVIALFFIDPSAEITAQWGINGEPRNAQPAWIAFLLMPVISTFMMFVVSLLKHIDPRRENIKKSKSPISAIILAAIALLFLTEIAIVADAMGYAVIGPRGIIIAVGAMLAVVANYLPKTRSNWFFGIRTPWTLSSDEIWRKTHRLGSRTIMAGGLIVTALGAFVTEAYLPGLIITVLIPATLIPVIYSWYLWHQGQRDI